MWSARAGSQRREKAVAISNVHCLQLFKIVEECPGVARIAAIALELRDKITLLRKMALTKGHVCLGFSEMQLQQRPVHSSM